MTPKPAISALRRRPIALKARPAENFHINTPIDKVQ